MPSFVVDIPDGQLYGVEAGHGAPVIFLHAGVCDHRMWQFQIDDLSADIRAIAYDRRGFGQSFSKDVEFDDVDDLLVVMDTLKLEKAILVGCSMGGGVALEFALRFPDRVAGLFLVASSMRGAPVPAATAQEDAIEAEYERIEAAADDKALNQFEADVWLEGVGQKSGRVAPELRALFLEMNGTQISHPHPGRHVQRSPYFERLGEIDVPTLLLAGTYDFSYYRHVNEMAAERISDSVNHMIEGSAHLPNMDNVDQFNALLSDFLAQF